MVIALSLPNEKYGHLLPAEDAFMFNENEGIFAVADGITRDPANPPGSEDGAPNFFSDRHTETIEEIFKRYPNPSGARMAADAFCSEFAASIKRDGTVKEAFFTANKAIKGLNDKHVPEPDYLVNDFYGCAACGARMDGDTLHWGVVADCGVIVFNSNGEVKLHTPNSFAVFKSFEASKQVIFDWNTPEGRRLVRKEYRNQPEQMIGGVRASYGALTGEASAESFIYYGTQKLEAGDLIVLFSDGFEATVLHEDFFRIMKFPAKEQEKLVIELSAKLSKESYTLYGHERTLIATTYPL